MAEALELARQAASLGEVPVGALIVKDNQVISRAYNQRECHNQATAHAEILAIEEASRKL
ncbi:MAG: nucleoside deaminase, partial [Bdellovibrionales bacterium]|nr:nucleoside deaminase [Bdellovibrionales bacterium]